MFDPDIPVRDLPKHGWNADRLRKLLNELDQNLKDHFSDCDLCLDVEGEAVLCPVGRKIDADQSLAMSALIVVGFEEMENEPPPPGVKKRRRK